MENFEHVMRLEEVARHRMSRRTSTSTSNIDAEAQDGRKQGHYLRDLIISEATDWQVLTLHLAVHMQQLQAAISTASADAGQVRVLSVEREGQMDGIGTSWSCSGVGLVGSGRVDSHDLDWTIETWCVKLGRLVFRSVIITFPVVIGTR